ncbi:alpha/beta-hydrolase [Corynespora cassiicola Philippines]|uniref:Alpha/beta-hydrolase n=1 Tax=Corynespora cassiicola Philippines TaxID=1448308 RepID=A0A2T2NQ18_CORCC|nr:alpha/beta-hydrolase [Corynespora cassiicola Philippines]
MARIIARILHGVQHFLSSILSFGSSVSAYLFRLLTNLPTNNRTPPNPPTLKGAEKCRFPLSNDSSSTFTLSDGRKLGYAQYGLLTGRPILYMHGLPGSRIEAAAYHDLGLELGARIVSVDRPGIGWSSPHPGRKLLDFPKDVGELAEHLGLESYAVMGVSGGGPYVLACAAALPREKLRCVSVVCGLGPPDIGMKGAGLVSKLGFPYGWRYGPTFLFRWFFQSDIIGRIDLPDEKRLEVMLSPSRLASITNKKDLDFLGDEDAMRLLLRGSREYHAQGIYGIREDGRAMCVDWGFRVEDIREDLPVHLWYGKQDITVPLNHGVQIAARLGGRAHLQVEDETHASIFANCKQETLEQILKEM